MDQSGQHTKYLVIKDWVGRLLTHRIDKIIYELSMFLMSYIPVSVHLWYIRDALDFALYDGKRNLQGGARVGVQRVGSPL